MNMLSPARLPSERRFGFMLAGALVVLGVYGSIRHWSRIPCEGCIGAAILCALVAYLTPAALAPLKKIWFRSGELLGKIVSPLCLGIIFFGILTPISIVTRLFGRDELGLKRRAVNSYWRHRAPVQSVAASFRNQF